MLTDAVIKKIYENPGNHKYTTLILLLIPTDLQDTFLSEKAK